MISGYMTHWLWFGAATLLIIFEVAFGASFFLLWLGIAAAIVGVTVWVMPSLGEAYQVLVFAGIAVSSIVLWRRCLKRHPAKTDRPALNRRAEQYIGRTFVLSEPIVNGRGKIQVDDSTWRVEGVDLPSGAPVQVVGVDGVVLKVIQRPL